MKQFILVAIVFAVALFAGCVQQQDQQATATPQPTVMPTARPFAPTGPAVAGGFSENDFPLDNPDEPAGAYDLPLPEAPG